MMYCSVSLLYSHFAIILVVIDLGSCKYTLRVESIDTAIFL